MNETTVSKKYTKRYYRTVKKIKKQHNELANLEKIISMIKNSSNINELKNIRFLKCII